MPEELDPKAGTEGEDALADGADPTATTGDAPPEPGPVEALAGEMGWVPKDQFRGDEADWKEAGDFIKAGRDINRTLARDLKATRDEVSRIARTSADMTAQAIADRDAHWQSVQAKAVEEGDNELVNRAVEERMKLKTAAAPANEGEPAETLAWKDRHQSWFGKDRVATGRALEVAEKSRLLGASVDEQLQDAERAIKREFPELFPAAAKRPAGVHAPGARNANKSSAKKGFADMPAESQAMAKDYLARHGIPLEKTAESYFADIEKNERKVV